MKNILITGANKGIGFETAKQLAQLGHTVFLGSRDAVKGAEAIEKLKSEGIANVQLLVINVTDMASIQNAEKEVAASVPWLDVLINNAAITGPQPQNISVTDIALFKEVFDTNYFGAIRTTQVFLPLLQKSPSPHIINISSEVGSLTLHTSEGRNPNWNNFHAYGSSKTALNSFTVMLANELENTNVRVNSVTPGYTATDLNQHQGFKTAEEGAKPIVDLALSDSAGSALFLKEGGTVPW
jgi:NAD(P)-dependent dehydrogenase (short-subunit alcohol dehydrogenase family)